MNTKDFRLRQMISVVQITVKGMSEEIGQNIGNHTIFAFFWEDVRGNGKQTLRQLLAIFI